MFIYFLLLARAFSSTLTVTNITPASFYIYTTTTYTINLQTITTIPTGGYISIIFPGMFTLLPSEPLTCTSTQTVTCSCTFAANTLSIKNCFPLSPSTFKLTLYSVPNPIYAKTSKAFQIYTYSDSSSLLDSQLSGPTITFIPYVLVFATISPNGNVGDYSMWSISLNTAYQIPASGYVYVTFPVWSAVLGTGSQLNYCTGTQVCSETSSLKLTLACQCTSNVLSIVIPVSYTGSLTITISSIRNSPTTTSLSGFSISTGYLDGYIEVSSGLTTTISTPAPISKTSFTISGSTQISTTADYYFEFTTTTPIAQYSTIAISFPSSFILTQISGVLGIFGLTSTSYSISANTLTITGGFSTGYLLESQIIAILISKVTNPSSTKPSDSISIKVSDNKAGSIAYLSSGLSVTASSGSLISVSISPLVGVVGASTVYSFSFGLQHSVPVGGGLWIQFPAEISAGNTSGNCFYIPSGSALSSTAQCSISDNRNLWLTSGFPTGNLTSTVTLQLTNVKNSLLPTLTSTFAISTYSDTAFLYQLDTFTGSSLQFTASTLKITAVPSSYTTGDLTSYNFSITPNTPIPLKANIEIVIPIEIIVTAISCTNLINFPSPAVCALTSQIINITQGFESGGFTSGTLWIMISGLKNPGSTKPSSNFVACTKFQSFNIDCDSSLKIVMSDPHLLQTASVSVPSIGIGEVTKLTVSFMSYNEVVITNVLVVLPKEVLLTGVTCGIVSGVSSISCESTSSGVLASIMYSQAPIEFTVAGVTMPGSLKPTSSFAVYTKTTDYLIDYCASGLTISATIPGSFASIETTLQDSGINKVTTYTITLKTSHTIPTSGYLTFAFPTEITFTTPISCTFLSISTACDLQTSLILFYPPTPLVPSLLSLSISRLKNPSLTSISPILKLSSYTSDNYLIDQSNSPSIAITCYSPCTTCMSSPDICTSCTNLYLWGNSCHSNCDVGYYSIPLFLCSLCSDNCFECTGESGNCSSCVEGLYLYNDTCVSICPDMYWGSESVCISCGDGCEVCGLDGCEKCNVGVIYNGACVEQCNGVVIGNQCFDCDFGCDVCIGSPSNCTACTSNYLYYENKCYFQCPASTAKNGEVCDDCSEDCKTCTSATKCQECQTGYFLYLNTCYSACPDGSYPSNTSCNACSAPCLTCDISSCTSCLDNYFLYNGQCLSTCPLLTTVPLLQNCIECTSNCNTCTIFSDSCESCSTGLYLYSNQCISNCPSGTFKLNTTCYPCADNCLSCEPSTGLCLICNISTFFYNYNCLSTCPDNVTVNVNGICEDCNEKCLACRGKTDYCTLCNTGIAYLGECLNECPEGFYSYEGTCTELCAPGCTLEMLSNENCDSVCNIQECDYDNFLCASGNFTSSLALTQAPFPSSSAGVATIGISGVSKYFVRTTSFVSSSISMMSVTETGSWVGLAYQLNNVNYLHGRELLEDQEKMVLALGMLLGLLLLHFIENLVFALVYYYQVLQKDEALHEWTKVHKCSSGVILAFSCLVSFKIIRTLLSNLFGFKSCSASLTKMSMLYRPLLIMTYISLATTSLPIICLLVYILSTYSSGNIVFILALDSLITTSIMTLLSIPDLIYMHNQVSTENKIYLPEFFGGEVSDNLCVETFQVYENKTEIDIEKAIYDTNLTATDRPFLEVQTADKENEIVDNKENFEFFIEKPEVPTNLFPDRLFSPPTTKNKPPKLDFLQIESLASLFIPSQAKPSPVREIITSEILVVDAEPPKNDSNSSQISVESIAAPRPFEFEIFDSSKEFIDEENEPQLLETILEESDLLLSSADIDMFDPECITVQHRPSGLTVLIKKGFSDAELEDGTRLNTSHYSICEIDSSDLHYAILRRSNSDSYFRAKRDFSGGTIVDVEMRSGVWLVGRTVRREEDFDFENAEIGNDPESVIAVHNVSGVKFNIRKSFVGAVNSNNELLEEYFEQVEVDSQDVHCGYVYGDVYVRSFVGGLITAILEENEDKEEEEENEEKNEEKNEENEEKNEENEEKNEENEEKRPQTCIQDRTAYFDKPPEMTFIGDEYFMFNQEEFSSTFTDGFYKKESQKGLNKTPSLAPFENDEEFRFSQEEFSSVFAEDVRKDKVEEFVEFNQDGFSKFLAKNKEVIPSVSSEMQTEEPEKVLPKLDSCLSLTILDTISISPTKLNIFPGNEIITFEEPVKKPVYKRFTRFENISEESASVRSKSSTISKPLKKRKKPSKTSSRSSSKANTPKNSPFKPLKLSNSPQSSYNSLESIYLQRLRTPKDSLNKVPSRNSTNSLDSYPDLSLSLQMSLTKLNKISVQPKKK